MPQHVRMPPCRASTRCAAVAREECTPPIHTPSHVAARTSCGHADRLHLRLNTEGSNRAPLMIEVRRGDEVEGPGVGTGVVGVERIREIQDCTTGVGCSTQSDVGCRM